jgi:mono/diheme cytochrome c family protein
MIFRPALILSWCALLAAPAFAGEKEKEDPNAPVSYFKKVRPIFQAQCQGCHQPAKAKGGYVMTDFAKLLEGGESVKDGKHAVVPKDPEHSLLVKQITPHER